MSTQQVVQPSTNVLNDATENDDHMIFRVGDDGKGYERAYQESLILFWQLALSQNLIFNNSNPTLRYCSDCKREAWSDLWQLKLIQVYKTLNVLD